MSYKIIYDKNWPKSAPLVQISGYDSSDTQEYNLLTEGVKEPTK